jgi:ABC-type Fe3+-siderophore transport system permease subunit
MDAEPKPDGDDEIRLAPEEGLSREEIERESMPRRRTLPLADQDRERIAAARRKPRFSLAEVLAVTTFVAVGLGGARWLPPGVFAGLSSAGAMLAVFLLLRCENASRGFRLVMCGIVLAYVAAALASLVAQLV